MQQGIDKKLTYERHIKKNSLDIYNEIYFRCTSAINCLDVIEHIQKSIINEEFKSVIKYSLIRTAIIELTSILDSTSNYSIRIYKNSSSKVDEKNIRRICPNLNNEGLSILKNELNNLIKSYEDLIEVLFKARNEQIAHAIISSYKNRISYKKFPILRTKNFANRLLRIFIKVLLKEELPSLI